MALPTLVSTGLPRVGEEHFELPNGYYGLSSIMLLLALARVKALACLRCCSPGEWGKLLVLDRGPEVRTLRNKLRLVERRAVSRMDARGHQKPVIATDYISDQSTLAAAMFGR
ncbi:MAG: hypothetical protein CME06_06625 [Gemmatimonadetes bacterium]|nr:hypothetical protein [Gemmatimonadota bacterium]